MAKQDTAARLAELEERFAKFRKDRAGRAVRAYPEELWSEVAALSLAGVSNGELCRRCGLGGGTLANGLGRAKARAKDPAQSERARSPAVSLGVKSLRVEEPTQAPVRTCDVVFPNGVVIRLALEGLDEVLLGRIRSC